MKVIAIALLSIAVTFLFDFTTCFNIRTRLSMASDSELPYTGRIQNFIGQSRRDIVEPWEGGAPPAPSAAKTTPPPTSLNFCPQATAVNATCLV